MRKTFAILTTSLLLLISPLRAGVEPVGSEFQVNSHTTDHQAMPWVAIDDDGDFVVVWTSVNQDGSAEGVFGQRFDISGAPLGSEFRVNTFTLAYQYLTKVAMEGDGDFVVVWPGGASQDGSAIGVFGQRFDSTGAAVGVEFQVNSYTTFDQGRPAVAQSASGDTVVVWNSMNQDGSALGVFGQRYDGGGMKLGGEFQVNTTNLGSQFGPVVAADPAGAFVVAWNHDNQYTSGWEIFARRFDTAGAPLGGEFRVNTYTTSYQQFPEVVMHGSGAFVVVWQSQDQVGSETSIFGQRYDSAGSPLGGEFRVNTNTRDVQIEPAIAADGAGGFVVVWRGGRPGQSAHEVLGQRFDNTGARVGGEFQVNTYTTSYQFEPAVAMDSTGDLVVVWNSSNQDGSASGVFGQQLVRRGPELTSPVEGGLVDCSDPVSIQPTFTWDDDGYDRFKILAGSDPAFKQGTFVSSGDGFMAIATWTPTVKKWRSACNKAIAADPMKPVMFFKVLGKDLHLPKGDPALKSSSTVVQVDLQP